MPPMFTRLAVLFFFSGASALVYQVLWLRQLSLIFGVTIYAASTVLATFMTGLAIGSAAAGRLSDRVRCPLLWFGATEALIGLTALVLPRALDLVTTGYLAVAPDLESRTLATAVRFACSAAVPRPVLCRPGGPPPVSRRRSNPHRRSADAGVLPVASA